MPLNLSLLRLRFKRKETATLSFILLSTWTIGFYNYADNLKWNFYVNTEDEFMARLDQTFNASITAREDMIEWLGKNYHRLNFNSSDEVLFYSKDSAKLKLCIGVLTKTRNNGPISYDYVSQTVISILARVRLTNQANIRIVLYNADPDDSEIVRKLGSLVHIEQIRKPLSVKVDLNNYADKKVKEAVDYISVMKNLYSYKDCKYGLLVEDDSIAAPNWYESLTTALNEIELTSQQTKNNWICLKLFTGFRWFDWLIHIPTVLGSLLQVFLWTLFQILALQILTRYCTNSSGTFHYTVIGVIGVNLLIFIVVLNSSVINPLGHGIKVYDQGFNAVAVIYPREQLKLFSDYLEAHIQKFFRGELERIPKDILLSRYKAEKRLNEYIIEPSIFQHVGVHSSLRQNLGEKPKNIKSNQYRPFQSYSFMKSYPSPVTFDPVYWTSIFKRNKNVF